MNEALDEDSYESRVSQFWEPYGEGEKDPVNLIYVAPKMPEEDFELTEIEDWGDMTGWWSIRRVHSCDEAIQENNRERAELFVLLDPTKSDARRLAKKFPETPISIATPGGWGRFPDGWPTQVVVAQWATPRPTEFGDGIADALSRVSTSIVYESELPRIEVFKEVSEELLAKLSECPEDRFRLDPRLFEETVAELLTRMGYESRITPRSGDKGRDILAWIKTPVAPILLLVECKRYARNRRVGPEPITRLWSRLFDDHANMAMVITTSSFQPIAEETAKSRGYQIDLKDGEDFMAWVRSLRKPESRS